MIHQPNSYISGNQKNPESAVILVHGRGSQASDILPLASHFVSDKHLLIAPQATKNSWYPYSFLAPEKDNQPWLDSALEQLDMAVRTAKDYGVASEYVYLMGFSQGACLTIEYASRHARRYAGIAVFSGGLIGDNIPRERYRGDFEGTPIFLGSSDPDAHIPVERVHDSAGILQEMRAKTKVRIYRGMGHRISEEELTDARKWLFDVS